ncbi:MAG: hypothetical protein BGO49_01505 [Planctomycetales bacterium 71-10]|nr:MAG: hypothetical protein BGO49_01505 [Planctomycetales bacterium 71-10]
MPDQSEQFQARVEELVAQFEDEIDRSEWTTRRYPKRFRDADCGIREIPALFLQKGTVRLLLDPIGYDIPGAEGLADIYLMPAYDPQASIYFEEGRWRIHYAFPADPVETRSKFETRSLPVEGASINQILDSIAEHAIP